MASEIAVVSTLSNNATVANLLGSPLGSLAKVHMGHIPQGEQLPSITVIRSSTQPTGDQKGNVSALDEEKIIVTIHTKNYVLANQLSVAVRNALDAIPAGSTTTFQIGGAADQVTIKLDHIYFTDEQYIQELDGDNIKDVFEQEYTARVQRI